MASVQLVPAQVTSGHDQAGRRTAPALPPKAAGKYSVDAAGPQTATKVSIPQPGETGDIGVKFGVTLAAPGTTSRSFPATKADL
ncbi:hypothetical protein DIPPA_08209 [Diplonema papillatum]|nr:hypothetical protein DIPPA_08209 [Diplonema papillatum]